MANDKQPLLWASALRIFAALCVFIYHFLVMSDMPTYYWAMIGLSIFFFLAGWFGNIGHDKPSVWFFKRVRRILIPYWPVIFIVLIANRIVGYKETTILRDVITFAGFSYFLDNPVYIISWFITAILILDSTLFVFKTIKNKIFGYLFLAVIGCIFIAYDPMLKIEIILFYAGFILGGLKGVDNLGSLSVMTDNRLYRSVNSKLYYLQSYTYSFFLIHGAALIFVFHILKFHSYAAFSLGMVLSIIGAYIHNKLLKRFS